MGSVTQLQTKHPEPAFGDDVVLLTVPADGGYLGVLRTATAGLTARLHFALDEIEDLRIAVDEACAMLLAIATRGAELECRFAVTDDAPYGVALWFLNYSTWEGTHGIHLEDLYVRPQARGTGAGGALLATLARICVDRSYRRLEWVMLDWNPAADFYAAIGAKVVEDWLPYRLSGAALTQLAERASPVRD